jgi:hypothetical protein
MAPSGGGVGRLVCTLPIAAARAVDFFAPSTSPRLLAGRLAVGDF